MLLIEGDSINDWISPRKMLLLHFGAQSLLKILLNLSSSFEGKHSEEQDLAFWSWIMITFWFISIETPWDKVTTVTKPEISPIYSCFFLPWKSDAKHSNKDSILPSEQSRLQASDKYREQVQPYSPSPWVWGACPPLLYNNLHLKGLTAAHWEYGPWYEWHFRFWSVMDSSPQIGMTRHWLVACPSRHCALMSTKMWLDRASHHPNLGTWNPKVFSNQMCQ